MLISHAHIVFFSNYSLFLFSFQRSFDKSGDGWLRRNDFVAWADRASKPVGFPIQKFVSDLHSYFRKFLKLSWYYYFHFELLFFFKIIMN